MPGKENTKKEKRRGSNCAAVLVLLSAKEIRLEHILQYYSHGE